MNHHDHVALLRGGFPETSGATDAAVAARPVWADIGSGGGAFTLALAELLGDGVIHSVDRDHAALIAQERTFRARFPATLLRVHQADFTQSLDLPTLDGIVMANALHFVRDKLPVVRRLRALLRPGGRMILVEYDADRGNRWVPYPLSYPTWAALAHVAGFGDTRFLTAVPSRFLGAIYAAVSEY
ncbi:MAG: class I SAM-dependent methyltransferase [Chloroflexota bacterium]|nr:class I SAM-dependent methyltransferase [Chloroflexota bacterium]